jgi:hypothetical protein
VGATEDTFARLAAANSVDFERGVSQDWLTNKGHLEEKIRVTLDEQAGLALDTIYRTLGGDEKLLLEKRGGSNPRIDFVLARQTLIVEVDEIQHFTSDRLTSLDLYPPRTNFEFDVEEYRSLVVRWRKTGDGYRAAKPTRDFPFAGGRRAQRAYFDALRDLAAPSLGWRVLRLPAPECDGAVAYARFKVALKAL